MRKRPPILLLLCLAINLLAQLPAPQSSLKTPAEFLGFPYPDTQAGKLLRTIKEHAEVMANVEYLSDVIGPRLTGSESLRQAQNWAMLKMRQLGASNVHEEDYVFGYAWSRGMDSARLLTHNNLRFRVDQVPWSPSTKGTVAGELILSGARSLQEFQALKGQLKGRIVLRTDPEDKRPLPPRRWDGKGQELLRIEQTAIAQFLYEEGALATLSMSGRKNGLSWTSNSPGRDPNSAALPAAYVPQEPYRMLVRLLARKAPVRIELSLGGTFSKDPVRGHNVVAEITGTQKPEEIVIVGAHLDSWDLGTGATDNATGCSIALEVLRALQSAGLKPKRTLRVILWSGEEQGLLGSRAYVEAHRAEMANIQAVLIHDGGTGMVKGYHLQGRDDSRSLMAMAIAPLNDLGVKELPLFTISGSDHAPFNLAGVPAFAAFQEPVDYYVGTHHTQMDFPDHVLPDQLIQGAQAIAVTAWELANMEGRLPHGQVTEPLQGSLN